jgi:hypothetical protein
VGSLQSRRLLCAHCFTHELDWGYVVLEGVAYAGNALFLVRNSQSSRVKMSFVTAAIEKRARRFVHSWSIRAVFPDPTGLMKSAPCSVILSILDREVGPIMIHANNASLPSNTYGKSSIFPVPVLDDGHLASEKASRTIQNLMSVSMVCCAASVRM